MVLELFFLRGPLQTSTVRGSVLPWLHAELARYCGRMWKLADACLITSSQLSSSLILLSSLQTSTFLFIPSHRLLLFCSASDVETTSRRCPLLTPHTQFSSPQLSTCWFVSSLKQFETECRLLRSVATFTSSSSSSSSSSFSSFSSFSSSVYIGSPLHSSLQSHLLPSSLHFITTFTPSAVNTHRSLHFTTTLTHSSVDASVSLHFTTTLPPSSVYTERGEMSSEMSTEYSPSEAMSGVEEL